MCRGPQRARRMQGGLRRQPIDGVPHRGGSICGFRGDGRKSLAKYASMSGKGVGGGKGGPVKNRSWRGRTEMMVQAGSGLSGRDGANFFPPNLPGWNPFDSRSLRARVFFVPSTAGAFTIAHIGLTRAPIGLPLLRKPFRNFRGSSGPMEGGYCAPGGPRAAPSLESIFVWFGQSARSPKTMFRGAGIFSIQHGVWAGLIGASRLFLPAGTGATDANGSAGPDGPWDHAVGRSGSRRHPGRPLGRWLVGGHGRVVTNVGEAKRRPNSLFEGKSNSRQHRRAAGGKKIGPGAGSQPVTIRAGIESSKHKSPQGGGNFMACISGNLERGSRLAGGSQCLAGLRSSFNQENPKT